MMALLINRETAIPLLFGGLVILNVSLVTGFNMGLTADSRAEAGINETLADRMLGEERSLDNFPNESRSTDGSWASEAIEDHALVPALQAALPVMYWSAKFAYSHRDWPPAVFHGISLSLTLGIFGLGTWYVYRLVGQVVR